MKKSLALIAITAMLTLSACASTPAVPAESSSPETKAVEAEKTPGKGNISSSGVDFTTLTDEDLKLGTDDTFEFITNYNTEGTIRFVKNTDPLVVETEKFLSDASGYHREYMVVEVDNREGTETANMYQIDMYDPDGASYTFTKARDLVDDAGPIMNIDDTYTSADGQTQLTEAEYTKLRDRGYKLSESLTYDVNPLGKETFIMAMPIDEGELPQTITGVTVMAHGGLDEVPAHNQLVSEYKEWKAFQEEGKEWEAHKPDAESLENGE